MQNIMRVLVLAIIVAVVAGFVIMAGFFNDTPSDVIKSTNVASDNSTAPAPDDDDGDGQPDNVKDVAPIGPNQIALVEGVYSRSTDGNSAKIIYL